MNEAFGSYLGSEAKDYCWFQTESYDDAEKLMMNGWNVKIDEIKREIEKFSNNYTFYINTIYFYISSK